MNKKGFAPIILLIGAIIILAVAGGAYYFVKNSKFGPGGLPKDSYKTEQANNQQLTATSTNLEQGETADWKTYRNEKYGFKVKYPPNCEIKNIDELFYPGMAKMIREVFFEIINCDVIVEVFTNTNNLTLKQWNDLYRSSNPTEVAFGLDFSGLKLKALEINKNDGSKWQRATYGCCASYRKAFISTQNSNVYVVSSRSSDDPQKVISWATTEINDILTQIFSTFKFINPQTVAEKQLGLIEAVYEENGKRYLDIDYIQLNGFDPLVIVNNNPKIRIFEISSDVTIEVNVVNNPHNITYEEFKNSISPDCAGSNCYLKDIPWYIQIVSGIVVDIATVGMP